MSLAPQGLGKTAQAVAMLDHLWRVQGLRGPFLVVAPLSTLAHWQRTIEEWTSLHVLLYHGSREARELMLQHEFRLQPAACTLQPHHPKVQSWSSSSRPQAHYQFHVLLTTYEMLRDAAGLLGAIPWRVMVVDEAHRLKNKDSAAAIELRALQADHTVMLTGTPLQNNTTELWALLSLLDPVAFPSLEVFLARFGTLTGADQVDELKAQIRPYLLRRQKGDVLKGDDSLAPLEETVVWVEMTLMQKKMYRAVLESRRDVLVAGAARAPLPSLLNLQMELRKVCNQWPSLSASHLP